MRIKSALPLALGFCALTQFANAQGINVYFGLGTATNSSSGQQIDTFGTGNPYTTPKMGGLLGDLGASVMVTPHWGVGGDFSWKTSQGAYAGLNYRPFFYNIDGVYQPIKSKRFVPELRAGLGGVSLRYSVNQQYCDQFTGCSSANQFLESSHHFQVDMQAAARIYATSHLFVRPAVEAHYVNNFFQFGSNWVPQYSIGIGYTFGNPE